MNFLIMPLATTQLQNVYYDQKCYMMPFNNLIYQSHFQTANLYFYILLGMIYTVLNTMYYIQ